MPAGERSGPVSRAGHVQPVGGGVPEGPPERRPDEHLEGDEGADRVARQGHHGHAVDGAGALGAARLHGDLGELDGAEAAEGVLHHLVGAGADAAAGDQQVRRRHLGPHRRQELVDVVRDEVQPARLAAGVLHGGGQEQRSWTRRSGPAAAAAPARPARCRWTAPARGDGAAPAAVVMPTAAASPICAAPSGVPADRATAPAGDVLAGGAQVAARGGVSRISTTSVPPSVSSTGTTTSAPGGSGAPVMIRCTVPGARGTTSERPAGMSSATGSRTGDRAAPETSAHRAA